jgi:vitamin B12 transporter
MKTILLRTAFFSVAVLAVSFTLQAQSNPQDAHLSGTLLDTSGGGVGGVRVTARVEGQPSSQTWSAMSTAAGEYSLTLPPGRYYIQFNRSPFVPREFVLDLAPSESRLVSFRLDLERLSSNVVVTAQAEPTLAEETSASVSVFTRDEIDRRPSVSLPDLLLFAPGIAIGRTGREGGTASLFLNGGNSNFTKVLVDGAPINPPGGAVDFSNLTLDNIDKVEVVRGAESAIYGTDAVSGVIQMLTHRGTSRVPEFRVFGEGGSFSSARGGGEFSGLLGAFDYSLAASYLETAGQGPNDDFLNRTASGNFGYAFSDRSHVRLSLRNNTSEAGIPGETGFEPPSLYQRYALHVFDSNARWDFTTGTHWHHQISGAESYNRQHSFNPQQSFFATDPLAFCPQANPASVPTPEFCDFTSDNHYQYNRANLSAETSYLLRNFGGTAGYQYEVENASIAFLNVGHVRRNNQGGFLDFHYLPHPRVRLNFGARAEANANFGTRVVPRVGASLALRYGKGFWGDTRYRVFYGQGIKEPRFDQLYNDQFGDFGNPLLKPEASKNWSTGIEQKIAGDRLIFSGEYFSNRFYDIISFAFCSPLPPPARPTANSCGITFLNAPPSFGYFFNTDRARARGINMAVEARPLHWLIVVGNYAYVDSLVISAPNAFDPSEQAGHPLIRRPPHSGSLTMNAAFRHLNVSFAGYFTGARTDSDFLSFFAGNTCFGPCQNRNPGYARFDVATSYELAQGVSLYARSTNLFDKKYQDVVGFPALGRDVRVGMSYRFSGRN